MSSATPLVFSPVSPAQFAHLSLQAQASGIQISGNSGSAAKFGVEVAWQFDAATQQLTLQCLKTPFFVSRDSVEARLRALVRQSLASA
ncbi:MAG TPA: hypothetical protein VFU55_08395 [Terracidiphilus sp.]|nr:hypothetical protein [Terracidiphilus sp.]